MFGVIAFEPKFLPGNALFHGIEVDAFGSEGHNYQSLIAKHPVEEGDDVTSSIRLKAPTLDIQGMYTDTPHSFVNALFGTLNSFEGRSVEKLLDLINLRNKKKLFGVVTTLGIYLDYFFESLTFPRGVDDEYSGKFSAKLVKINYVQAAFGLSGKSSFGSDVLGPIQDIGATTPMSITTKLAVKGLM